MSKFTITLFSCVILMSSVLSCSSEIDKLETLRDYNSLSDANEILSFKILGLNTVITPVTLSTDSIAADLNYSRLITLEMPVDSSLIKLVPEIVSSPKSRVEPRSGVVQSFSRPVLYTVTAENGEERRYLVKITPYRNYHNNILLFEVNSEQATIDELRSTITLVLEDGFDLTSISPRIVLDPYASSTPLDGELLDFTHPVTYVVRAYDGKIKEYTVSISTLSTSTNSILAYSFIVDGVAYPAEINQSTREIAATLPLGTDITNLGSKYTCSTGAIVTSNRGDVLSLTDFSAPVIYTVTGTDGIAKNYTVKIEIQ